MDMTKLLAMADKASSEIAARSGGFNRPVRPTPGQSRWRILPPWKKGSDTIFRVFGQHFIKSVEGKVIGAFVCPSASAEEPGSVSCVHCDEVSALTRLTKDDDALQALREFRAGENYLFNAVRMDGDEKDKVVLFSLPGSLATNYFNTLASYLREGVNILDPKTGRDIIINRSGSGKNTKYSMTVAPKESEVPNSVLENMIDLDAYIAKEATRGKSNISKFEPALASVARSVGLPTPEVTKAIKGAVALFGGGSVAEIASPVASAPAAAISSAPAAVSAKESGRVISDEAMPWDEEEKETFSSTKETVSKKDDITEEALKELEALEEKKDTPEKSPEAEAPKEEAKEDKTGDEELDFLDSL